ncbi:MAG: hypothetical protein IPK85_22480 [Gemmatimonadetes bacterium]|nr:hypothetical protein [Gemmatimonadota bacterium]
MTGPSPSPGPPTAPQPPPFRDRRPPQEIQWQLERDLMVLFTPVPGAPQYTLQATMKFGTLRYGFLLRFEAALSAGHAYVLTATLTDPSAQPTPVAELQRQLASWMSFWARDWEAAEPGASSEPNNAQYQAIVQAARKAEAHLVTVHDLQQEVLRRMRAGACFRTAHKEGGTTITYTNGRWSRADYGDWNTANEYRDERKFLAFLREFFHTEVTRNVAPDTVPEETAWRLILRLLQPGPAGYVGPSRATRYGVLIWGMVVATSMIILFARLRIWVRGRAPVPGLDALVLPAAGVLGLCAIIAAFWLRRHWEPTPGAHRGRDDVTGVA